MTEKDSHSNSVHYPNKQGPASFSSQSENSSTNNALNYQGTIKSQRDSFTGNHRESLSVPEPSVSTYNEDSIHKVNNFKSEIQKPQKVL